VWQLSINNESNNIDHTLNDSTVESRSSLSVVFGEEKCDECNKFNSHYDRCAGQSRWIRRLFTIRHLMPSDLWQVLDTLAQLTRLTVYSPHAVPNTYTPILFRGKSTPPMLSPNKLLTIIMYRRTTRNTAVCRPPI